VWRSKEAECSPGVKHREIIADNLSKAGWSWGCVATVDRQGRTIWIVDAHRGDGQRFVVRADEKLSAFVELESSIHPDFETDSDGYPTVKSAYQIVMVNSTGRLRYDLLALELITVSAVAVGLLFVASRLPNTKGSGQSKRAETGA
jgi:hypothetical protein